MRDCSGWLKRRSASPRPRPRRMRLARSSSRCGVSARKAAGSSDHQCKTVERLQRTTDKCQRPFIRYTDSGPADLLGLPRRIASTEYDGWLRGGTIVRSPWAADTLPLLPLSTLSRVRGSTSARFLLWVRNSRPCRFCGRLLIRVRPRFCPPISTPPKEPPEGGLAMYEARVALCDG